VATVYDFVEHAGENFIVFEYVEGETLRQQLGRRRFSTEEILAVGMQLADALAAAHDRGIVHRDLKPENIKLTAGPERPGRVKVLDFGLAKLRRPVVSVAARATAAETTTASTAAGLLVGTVNYMAPEQLEGEPADARTDLYAAGLVLYEMATGVNPFHGRTPTSTIANILKLEPPPVVERNPVAPPELDRILRKCLRKLPEERYQSAREFFVDLANLRREVAPGSGRTARVAPGPPATVPLAVSRGLVRGLLALIQAGYLFMYALALYKLDDVERISRPLWPPGVWGPLLAIAAICGSPVRLYILSAVSLDYAELGRKFRWVFPAVLALDEVWAGSPLLFLRQFGGLSLLCAAALAYLPFSQRTLVFSAYAPTGGRTPAIRARRRS
jgi:hypothetical protein